DSSGPSTSSSWYYEDVDGKQWQHHSDSIPRDYPLTRSGHDRWPNQIEYLVQTYAKLRERRRLVYCPGTLRDILGGTEPLVELLKMSQGKTQVEKVKAEM
ncbi:unnamed protein product, partial [Anisakis simplex]|uniref:WWE domain-containing protein n=1 Tax=Anisakis simplex TaxID=6269 RepID=A0A0M3JCB0_ANISI